MEDAWLNKIILDYLWVYSKGTEKMHSHKFSHNPD